MCHKDKACRLCKSAFGLLVQSYKEAHGGGGIFCFGSFAVFVMAYAVVMAMPFLNSL